MWKPSKKTLFFLILFMAILTGISLGGVNWKIVEEGKNIFNEFLLPGLFIGLSFSFLIPYLKIIKEERI
jgi:hypothetical protein